MFGATRHFSGDCGPLSPKASLRSDNMPDSAGWLDVRDHGVFGWWDGVQGSEETVDQRTRHTTRHDTSRHDMGIGGMMR